MAKAAPAHDDHAQVADAAPALAAPATSAASAPPAAVRGAPETVANLAAQIVKKLGARTTHFDVQLDPMGLGRVNVRVEINADGRVSAAMSFDNPQAAAELRSRANELQRALAQSGFDLSGGLSFDVAQDQGGSYPGQQFQDGDNSGGQAFRGRAFAAALEHAGDAAQSALTSALHSRRLTPSGVDVRI
ncbi:flagellar hook-length control protein FliK [Phenylobacterium sp. LjRoot219]|uniref:flagellar hook-length control protein FliK n=1 Tax=Phenylobacterium sp. LjRoot219 TaxID=3342283 RepID=UPI003ECDA5EF